MACIGDETQTESSDVTPAWRQNESHPRAEIKSVNIRIQTTTTAVTTVIGALTGGSAGELVQSITEKQTCRALRIFIRAVVGAVVGSQYKPLIMTITIIAVLVAILLVVCWAIAMIGVRAGVIMKTIVTAITGQTGIAADSITVITLEIFFGIYPGLSVGMRDGIGQMPVRNAVYNGGRAIAAISVITAILAVTGLPVYQAVMALAVNMFVIFISTTIWAVIFRICAAILALEFKISIDALIKVAVFILATRGIHAAVIILILLLWRKIFDPELL